jgi:hypothetical protein
LQKLLGAQLGSCVKCGALIEKLATDLLVVQLQRANCQLDVITNYTDRVQRDGNRPTKSGRQLWVKGQEREKLTSREKLLYGQKRRWVGEAGKEQL